MITSKARYTFRIKLYQLRTEHIKLCKEVVAIKSDTAEKTSVPLEAKILNDFKENKSKET